MAKATNKQITDDDTKVVEQAAPSGDVELTAFLNAAVRTGQITREEAVERMRARLASS